MNTSQVYIAIAMVVLAVAAFVVFFIQKEKKHNKLTPLASLAFGFILFGFFFEEDRLIGYGLLGVGVVLSVIDMLRRSKGGSA